MREPGGVGGESRGTTTTTSRPRDGTENGTTNTDRARPNTAASKPQTSHHHLHPRGSSKPPAAAAAAAAAPAAPAAAACLSNLPAAPSEARPSGSTSQQRRGEPSWRSVSAVPASSPPPRQGERARAPAK